MLPTIQEDHLIDELMVCALAQDQIEGVNEVLKFIAQFMHAEGCILWGQAEPVEGEELTLFTLAHYFKNDENYVLHNLRYNASLAGDAIRNNDGFFVADVTSNEYLYKDTCGPLFEGTIVKSYLSVPVFFKDDNPVGALNIYFDQNFFSPPTEEIRIAKRIARQIPGIYQTIRKRADYQLLKDVNKIFFNAGVTAVENRLSPSDMDDVIQEVCEAVGKAFRAKDCSIMLEDEYDDIPGYEIRGTTSPEWIKETKKNAYQGEIEEGLVGWCLRYRKPVRIFNLASFYEDRHRIQKEHPKIFWENPLKIEAKAKKRFKKHKRVPPISFMSAPILLADGKLAGAIRCVMGTKGPYYYSYDDLGLLQLVATQIGQAWRSWINKRTVDRENEIWKTIVRSLESLNHFVRKSLKDGKLDEELLFEKVFQMVTTIIPDACSMDVRYFNEDKNVLSFKYFYGDLLSSRPDGRKRNNTEVRSIKKRNFSLHEPYESLGSASFNTTNVFIVNDVNNRFEARYYDKVFSDVKSTLVAPITGGHNKANLGVLSIQSLLPNRFPRFYADIFSLIGQQIGMYFRLKSIFEEKKRTYENLAHQLITPIDQAYKRSVRAVEMAKKREEVELHIRKIRGLCNKAKAVTGSIQLFVEFEQGKPISIKTSPMSVNNYIKMLVLCAADNKILTIPRMNLQYKVDSDSFKSLHQARIDIHKDLFMQALNNVLENAGKYSYKNTDILIKGGLTQNENFFYTSILNKGYEINASDVRKCIERGWRGAHVDQVTTGGSGIGLWIVNLIMKTLGGRLEIKPTNKDGWNEVRLILPII